MIKSQSRSKNLPVMIKKTAQNKVRNILKELNRAGKQAVTGLEERLNFWRSR